MPEGRYADWMVRQLAENFAEKCPQRDWFDGEEENYFTSLKSWSHITARQLYSMELDERQLIIFIHHLGIEHVGVQTFDPQDTRQQSDYVPSEGDKYNSPPLDIQPKTT
jgi:hypothetical protein